MRSSSVSTSTVSLPTKRPRSLPSRSTTLLCARSRSTCSPRSRPPETKLPSRLPSRNWPWLEEMSTVLVAKAPTSSSSPSKLLVSVPLSVRSPKPSRWVPSGVVTLLTTVSSVELMPVSTAPRTTSPLSLTASTALLKSLVVVLVSSSPRWARTVTIVARRSSPLVLLISALTSTLDLFSRPPRKLLARLSTLMCTPSASVVRLLDTRR
mmetsp:Transcript_7682/g.12906  ORF Transcript_7682/g.12906 Transcript_7682/m.12906 type:complete len:209 (-) Transcript_7682:242-868(-)